MNFIIAFYDSILEAKSNALLCIILKMYVFYIPVEYSQDILGIGCPLPEQGSNKAAPAETVVFCALHTQDGGSV